jgi:hypothetical protein
MEPHIAGVPAGDGDFWHGGVGFAVCVVKVCRQFVKILVNWISKLKNR